MGINSRQGQSHNLSFCSIANTLSYRAIHKLACRLFPSWLYLICSHEARQFVKVFLSHSLQESSIVASLIFMIELPCWQDYYNLGEIKPVDLDMGIRQRG